MHSTARSTPIQTHARPAGATSPTTADELSPVPWSNRWRCAELGLEGGVDPLDPALWGPDGPFGGLMEGLLPPTAEAAARLPGPVDAAAICPPAPAPAAPTADAGRRARPDEGTSEDPQAQLAAFADRAPRIMAAGQAALAAEAAGTSAAGLGPVEQARLEQLLAHDSLTVDEVAEARSLAEQLPAAERQEAHRAIAARSPYATQRDNAHSKEVDDGGTCFATSVAMALMSLGVPNPDPSVEYEVALLRLAQGDIEHSQTWIDVATGLGRSGALIEQPTINGWTLDQWRDNITAIIGGGQAAVLSINGHVVRVEGWDEEGLLIDDPYGASRIAVSEGGSSRDWDGKNKRHADETAPGAQVGEDVAYPWAVVEGYSFNYMVTFA
jgi:hypothetical protein